MLTSWKRAQGKGRSLHIEDFSYCHVARRGVRQTQEHSQGVVWVDCQWCATVHVAGQSWHMCFLEACITVRGSYEVPCTYVHAVHNKQPCRLQQCSCVQTLQQLQVSTSPPKSTTHCLLRLIAKQIHTAKKKHQLTSLMILACSCTGSIQQTTNMS